MEKLSHKKKLIMMLRKKYKKLLNEAGFKIYFNIKQWIIKQ